MELNLPTTEDVRTAYHQGEDAVIALIAPLATGILSLLIPRLEQQSQLIEQQNERIRELEARLAKNSSNSSKPPSSDGYSKPKRTKSQRVPGQKPNGGQPGHEGHTLQPTESVDTVIMHTPEVCQGCGSDLTNQPGEIIEERQVLDLPAMRLWVTAHQRAEIVCPCCQQKNQGHFPDNVTAPVQYGSGVNALATLFNVGHHLPVARVGDIFNDLFGRRISDASIHAAVNKVASSVQPVLAAIRQALIRSDVLHVDESGLRVEGSLHWLHVASTPDLTLYQVSPKRGLVAMEAADILPHYQGVLVHDHWKSYFHYVVCLHALCNAHHLRELDWVETDWEQPWAGAMRLLLLKIKAAVEVARQKGSMTLEPDVLKQFHAHYDRLIGLGLIANPAAPAHWGSKRKSKQTPPRNLLERLNDYKADVLRFMEDFRVPFDNNQGERDIRMGKLKQKIAGGFRTLKGAETFASVRSYLSTARKNGTAMFQAIRDALDGHPFYPTSSATPGYT